MDKDQVRSIITSYTKNVYQRKFVNTAIDKGMMKPKSSLNYVDMKGQLFVISKMRSILLIKLVGSSNLLL